MESEKSKEFEPVELRVHVVGYNTVHSQVEPLLKDSLK